jgi:hypothetical protein
LTRRVLFCYPLPCIPKLILAESPPTGTLLPPSSHSTLLLSIASGLFCLNGRPQPLLFQSIRDSFHRNGVYTPLLPTEAVAIPLGSNGNAFISLPSMPLRSLSFTTRGVHPPSPGSKIRMKPEFTTCRRGCPSHRDAGLPDTNRRDPHTPGESPALQGPRRPRRSAAATQARSAGLMAGTFVIPKPALFSVAENYEGGAQVFGVAAGPLFGIVRVKVQSCLTSGKGQNREEFGVYFG